MNHPFRVRLRAVAVVLAGLAALGGCGDDGGEPTASGASPTESVGSEEPSSTPRAELPEGFPSDVPLVDEEILSATEGAAGGPVAWSVEMKTSRAVEDVADEVLQDYQDWDSNAGSGSSADVSVLRFANESYKVVVTIGRAVGGVAISYVVKNAG